MSYFYTFALSMLAILIPLYAIYLGFDALQIGLVVSSQAVLQLVFRLFGGVTSDYFGEKLVLIISFSGMLVGALFGAYGEGAFWNLVLVQLFVGASRSIYWGASQSYASRIDPENSKAILGYLTSFANAGMVFGFLGGGFFATVFGYSISFVICAVLVSISLICSLIMRNLPRKENKKSIQDIFTPLPKVFSQRSTYLIGLIAFLAAMTIAATSSIYPIYFKDIGFGDTGIGFLSAMVPLGVTLVGFIFSVVLARLGQKKIFFYSVAGIGILTFVTPFVESYGILLALVTIIGISSGFLNILYLTMVVDSSAESERGVSFAAVGMFWSIAHLVIPSTYGVLAKVYGLSVSFWIVGSGLIILSLCTKPVFQLLSKRTNVAIETKSL